MNTPLKKDAVAKADELTVKAERPRFRAVATLRGMVANVFEYPADDAADAVLEAAEFLYDTSFDSIAITPVAPKGV